MSFTRYLGLVWPADAARLLLVSVTEVQACRDWLAARDAGPKTLNHRVSALSSFYRYLGLCAAELLAHRGPEPGYHVYLCEMRLKG